MDNRIKTQNDKAWELLFSKYDILNQIDKYNQFIISASQIKEYREPRLMAKFDHSVNLPYIFVDNNLAILPITRGDYIISNFNAYKSFENINKDVEIKNIPYHLRSINSNDIPSEAIAVNCALASGIFSDFLEDDIIYPTVSGRMGSGNFNFKINNLKTNSPLSIQVNNSQIEIDIALEGRNILALIEAKKDKSEDFIIRQLYYPFRLWQSKISKKVIPIFLVYSNGIYNLYKYEFQDLNNYNSLVLVKHKNYSIEDTNINISNIMEIILNISEFNSEINKLFPKIDNLQQLIDICELLKIKKLTMNDIIIKYSINSLQVNDYINTAKYLNLIDEELDNKNKKYILSKLGIQIMSMSYKQRQLELCKCIFKHKIFYDIFLFYQNNGISDKDKIINIIKQYYNNETDEEYNQKIMIINSWIRWILKLI